MTDYEGLARFLLDASWLGPWQDDLNWAPSQLERPYTHPLSGERRVLYCRWRWDDPWEFHIYEFHGGSRSANWVRLGAGLSETDDVHTVHAYAEGLLVKHLARELSDTSYKPSDAE